MFSLFEDSTTIIQYIEKLREQRPENQHFIEDLIYLKYNNKKYKQVVKLIEGLDNKSPEIICLLILSLYYFGKKSDAIEVIENNKKLLMAERPGNFDKIFCIAAQCSRDILDKNKEQEYLEIVRTLDNGEELASVYNYINELNKNLDSKHRKKLNKDLYDTYLTTGKSIDIARQLYPNLSVNNYDEAEWICVLAQQFLKYNELSLEENIHYADALVVCKKWDELELLANKVIDRGNTSNIWMLIKAAALDEQGKSGEALSILDTSLDRDKRSIERAERYVYICMRLGLFEKAEDKLQKLLESASPDKHLSILESLIFIYSSDTEYNTKLLSAIIRYGELVDQTSEQQEGQYLLFFFTLTNRPEIDVSAFLPSFRRRFEEYTCNFPNSRIFRKGHIKENASSDELIKSLKDLTGVTDEQESRWKKNKNLIRHRKLSVPFALLHLFLSDISDVFSAWVMSQFTSFEKKEYKLRHSTKNQANIKTLIDSSNSLLLDETTLLLLNKIGLLDTTCKKIKNIVIHKHVFQQFSRSSHIVMGSIYSSIPKKIIQIVSGSLNNIKFVGEVNPEKSLLAQYKDVFDADTQLLVCSDDLVFTEVMKSECKKTNFINTLNIIDYLVEKEVLDGKERIKAIEKICSLGLENPFISMENLVDSLKMNIIELGNNSSITDSGFISIFNAVFPFGADFVNALDYFSTLISKVISSEKDSGNKEPLQDLITIFIVRFPAMSKKQILASIYCWVGIKMDVVNEHEFVPRSRPHYFLWELIKHLWFEGSYDNSRSNISEIFTVMSDLILIMTTFDSSSAYDKHIQAFIPETEEYDLFKKIYTERAIRVRQKK